MAWNPPPWTVRVSDATGSLHTAIAHVDAARLSALNAEIISTMWSPWRCPASHLPWLAWALSVDTWDASWSEIEKRREIAIAPEVHRRKGTRRAVETSLQRLGIPFELIEWWQAVPERRRGTFRVRIHNDDTSGRSDHSIIEEATARVRSSKPKSRVAEIRVGPIGAGPLGVSAAVFVRDRFVSEPRLPTGPLINSGPLGVTASVLVRDQFISEPKHHA